MSKTNKAKVVILEEYCKGCGCCSVACPKGLLMPGTRINIYGYNPTVFIDSEGECQGCALCARFCSDAAIEIYQYD